MTSRQSLKIKIFADGANAEDMVHAYKNKWVDGFTTNPSLMRKSGVTDYEKFAKGVLEQIKDMPISFEVFSDDLAGMEREARKIKTWGSNVYIKIPVQNTKGEPTAPLIKKLAEEGCHLNITAILTLKKVREVAAALNPKVPSVVSVFAGRIADTGVDPIPTMKESAAILKNLPLSELLWASTRETINLVQAEECGCKIITVPNDILKKLGMMGKSLEEVELDTVQTFFKDSTASGFKL
jgi:transaldolase